MYELYWLSKDLCRCSVEKTFPKYGDLILFNSSSLALLTSSLSCDNREIRNRDIFHLACFCLSLFLESLVSVLFFKNSFGLKQKGQKCTPERPSSWMKGFFILIGYQVCRHRVFTQSGQSRLEVSRGEWTGPKLSATKVPLNIFQSKQLDSICLLFKQIILPSKKRLSLSSSLLYQERNRSWLFF